MDPRLDERYFDWLYDQVGSEFHTSPSRTYLKMLEQLFLKEFVWFIPNDDNRAEDGRQLRQEFLDENPDIRVNGDWLEIGCSMLELFIGLSRRLSFEGDGESRDWFWVLIENTGLYRYNDRMFRRYHEREIDDILDRIIWRTYKPNGHGGLFPLQRAHDDQRDVELWYQLSAYLLEKIS